MAKVPIAYHCFLTPSPLAYCLPSFSLFLLSLVPKHSSVFCGVAIYLDNVYLTTWVIPLCFMFWEIFSFQGKQGETIKLLLNDRQTVAPNTATVQLHCKSAEFIHCLYYTSIERSSTRNTPTHLNHQYIFAVYESASNSHPLNVTLLKEPV